MIKFGDSIYQVKYLQVGKFTDQFLLDQSIENFKKNIKRFIDHFEGDVINLKKVLSDVSLKSLLQKKISSFNLNAFITAWEGALKLVESLEVESEFKDRQADLELLVKDLKEVLKFINSPFCF